MASTEEKIKLATAVVGLVGTFIAYQITIAQMSGGGQASSQAVMWDRVARISSMIAYRAGRLNLYAQQQYYKEMTP